MEYQFILAKLGIRDLFRAKRVCRKWKEIIESAWFPKLLPKSINHLSILMTIYPDYKFELSSLVSNKHLTEEMLLPLLPQIDEDLLSDVVANKNISLKFITDNINWPWNMTTVCVEKKVSIDFIRKYKDRIGSWFHLTMNTPVQMILESPDLPWVYSAVRDISLDIIKQYPELPFGASMISKVIKWKQIIKTPTIILSPNELSLNPNITWGAVSHYSKFPWNYRFLTGNPGIEIRHILANPDRAWDWRALSCRKDLTVDIIRANPSIKWDIGIVTLYIAIEEIIKHSDFPWIFSDLSIDKFTWDVLKNIEDKTTFDWEGLSTNKSITFDIIMDNPQYPWDIDMFFSCNVNTNWKMYHKYGIKSDISNMELPLLL